MDTKRKWQDLLSSCEKEMVSMIHPGSFCSDMTPVNMHAVLSMEIQQDMFTLQDELGERDNTAIKAEKVKKRKRSPYFILRFHYMLEGIVVL